MKAKWVPLMLVSAMFLSLVTVSPVMAAEYKVGIDLNTTAKYDASVSGSPYNKTHLAVFGIVGPEVHLRLTNYIGDMYYSVTTLTGNVSDISVEPYLMVFLIASGLQEADEISPGSAIILSETVTQTWCGVSRQINHFDAGGVGDLWWDQETGLMVKANFQPFGWLNFTLTETNAWEPMNLLSTTNLLLAAAGIELLIIVVLVVKLSSKGAMKKTHK